MPFRYASACRLLGLGLIALGLQAPLRAHDSKPVGAAVQAFVAEARRTAGAEITDYRVRTIGSTNRASEAIIPLILAGRKTGTFSLAAEFEDDPASMPRVGSHVVVTRFDGTPAFVYRLTEVQVVPFGDITSAHIQMEGPGLRELGPWREVHLAAWEPLLNELGRAPSAAMPVVVQRFVVVHPHVPAMENVNEP